MVWVSLLLFGLSASAFEINFNQAWFKTQYAHSYKTGDYDENEVHRIMKLAKDAGTSELRLWFFEASVGNVPKKSEIANMIRTLQVAREHGLKIYFTFFDAWSQANMKKLFSQNGTHWFLSQVAIPLFKKIEAEGLTDVISKIDLVNEGDALIDRNIISDGWVGVKRFVCQWKSAISSVRTFQKVPMTLSLRLNEFASLPPDLFDDQGTMACADFFDFHSYHTTGVIDRCDQLKAYVATKKKMLVLGEFGQGFDAPQYDDQLQLENTRAYSINASACGFSQAFAWRLSDVRPGENPEARFSFESFGKTRPAYSFIHDLNSAHR